MKTLRPVTRIIGLALLSTTVLSSVALADTSGSVTLSGSVASTLSITSTATAEASALDLDGDGSAAEHIVKVADLAITTNNEAGFTLTATSGSLTKAGGASIAYQVTSVADAAAAPASGAFTIDSGTDYTVATAAAGAGDQDLYIKYTPAALQDPGTYSGTITLTVADN